METLAFLPGLMMDARLFAPQMMAFSAERPVMALPVTRGERIEEIGSVLLDLLPKRVALCGQGFGAVVAMEILRRAPERVSRIALIAASPQAETPQEAADREPRLIAARAGRLDDALREEVPPGILAPGPGRAAIAAHLLEMGRDLGLETYLRQSRAMQRRRDQQGALARCKVPALWLSGAADTGMAAKRQDFLAELMPDAQAVSLEGAGHVPSLEAPDATIDVLAAWLARPFRLA